MPGPVLHLGAVVQCSHGAPAQPTVPSPRVMVSGMPATTIVPPWTVIACPAIPCTNGQWMLGALRVTSMGQPLAIQTGVGITAPTGAPMVALWAQPRVVAS